jgi:hypothetical protein
MDLESTKNFLFVSKASLLPQGVEQVFVYTNKLLLRIQVNVSQSSIEMVEIIEFLSICASMGLSAMTCRAIFFGI